MEWKYPHVHRALTNREGSDYGVDSGEWIFQLFAICDISTYGAGRLEVGDAGYSNHCYVGFECRVLRGGLLKGSPVFNLPYDRLQM
jgi:hypothetical protein